MPDKRQSILIVDHDAESRGFLADAVRSTVSNVSIVESGEGSEAFFKIDKQFFDLLITDVRMPKMEGIALIRKIGALPSHQRPGQILVISDAVSPEQVVAELGE